jgi:hypothetical protein
LGLDADGQLWEQEELSEDLQLQVQPDVFSPVQYSELSLRQLFESIEPTYPAKLVLELILARALLHLFDSQWAGSDLSMESISVLCRIERQEPYPFFDKTFISTRFGRGMPSQRGRSNRFSHPFPSILSLGILMAQIELGEDMASILNRLPPNEIARKPIAVAKGLLGKCKKRLPSDTGVLRSIGFCVEKESFAKFSNKPSIKPHENASFIEYCYTKIVRPLEEDLVKGAKWSWDEVNWLKPRQLDDSGIFKIITPKDFALTEPRHPPGPRLHEKQVLSPLIEEHTLPAERPQVGHHVKECVFDAGTTGALAAEGA